MRTTIDPAGRIVVPKSIREHLHLLDGGEVEISEIDGGVEIRPVPADVRVRDSAHGVVLDPTEALPPLTTEIVRGTIESVRR